jgi:glutamate carboxypeptidase
MILELEKYKDAEGLTCNCGMIQGGTAHNTVPGYCEFRANIRFVDEKQFDEISAVVEKLAANPHNPKCRIEAEIHGLRPAMERVERNLKLLDTINGIFAENGLETLEPVKKTGGSDAAHITKAGIPCLDNLGAWGGRIHSPDEYALCESLKNSAKQLAAIAYCI